MLKIENNLFWFMPWTHWHEITKEAFGILCQAGYEIKPI
jgi:hypothetical protein